MAGAYSGFRSTRACASCPNFAGPPYTAFVRSCFLFCRW